MNYSGLLGIAVTGVFIGLIGLWAARREARARHAAEDVAAEKLKRTRDRMGRL